MAIDVGVAGGHRRAAEIGGGGAEVLPVAGARDLEDEVDKVTRVEGGPPEGERGGLAFEYRRNDRPVTGDRDVDDHRIRAALYVDRFALERGGLELAFVLVAAGIGWILVFEKEILGVGVGVGETPGDPVVVTDHDARDPREGVADELVARTLEADLVPDRGVPHGEVRITGEDRLTGRGPRAGEGPAVGADAAAGTGKER